ncbi:neuroglobin-like [Haliotis rufescens]|uniref:neuroglobin-like n=1 Tax=Haliotis rufescens TaxID=6454 RepID=UPI00201F669D|nr:neuroglobin-like [Haliotis rufescens]
MGCRQAKPQHTENDKTVKTDNCETEFTTAVATDPRLPLDQRQVFRLKQSWKGIKRNMEQTGVEMFIRLFKTNAELKALFTSFKFLEAEDDLRENEALEHHATLVMTTLDDAFSRIDNYSYVTEVLLKTGESHRRFRGFRSEIFWTMRSPFLEAVKITLGDRYTENMETIYKIAITFILQALTDGFTEEHKDSNSVPPVLVESEP